MAQITKEVRASRCCPHFVITILASWQRTCTVIDLSVCEMARVKLWRPTVNQACSVRRPVTKFKESRNCAIISLFGTPERRVTTGMEKCTPSRAQTPSTYIPKVNCLTFQPQTIRILILEIWMEYGPVAQLGARFNRTEEVEGSNPSRSIRE